MSRPSLLLISPTAPLLSGYGPAMRAGMMIEALSSRYRVHLLVVPVIRTADPGDMPQHLRDCCEDIRVLPTEGAGDRNWLDNGRPRMFRFTTPENIERAHQLFQDVQFQAICAYRLYTAPFVEPFLDPATGSRPVSLLDLDDFESRSYRRVAALHDEAGNQEDADTFRAEADRFAAIEESYLPRFDRVFLCSELDREALSTHYQLPNTAVLPNAVRLPETNVSRTADRPFTFLFIGTLVYYPNEDAVLHFGRRVLPLLRRRAPGRFRFLVVGPHPPARVKELACEKDVEIMGEVDHPGSAYAEAEAAVVPIRAGGGTRIKILEAAAYRRPVVSTTLGAEGLEVTPEREILLADSPDQFADQCVRLMTDPDLRLRLARQASDWVSAHHTIQRLREIVSKELSTSLPTGA